jgi:hypothetical protein
MGMYLNYPQAYSAKDSIKYVLMAVMALQGVILFETLIVKVLKFALIQLGALQWR